MKERLAMARLGKRERAEKRARIARIIRAEHSMGHNVSAHTHIYEGRNGSRATPSFGNSKFENPMNTCQRAYRDFESGLTKQKSFG
jgi:hypothetical protein